MAAARGGRRRVPGAAQPVRTGLQQFPLWRMRAAEHAPRGRFYLLERRQRLAEIVERGAVVLAERHRVKPIILSVV